MKLLELGRVEFGDAVRVTDPCYKLDVWCSGQLGVKAGTFDCFLFTDDCGMICRLLVRYTDCSDEPDTPAPFIVGVDSGLCGVFDLSYYSAIRASQEAGSWYDKVIVLCHKTAAHGGITERRGVVSQAGGGDCSAKCRYALDKDGLCTAIELLYQ